MPASESEQVDITRLILEIREERAAQKAKEKADSWTKYVSLLVVFFAVATGIGALKAGGHSSRTVLRQAQASDQWAYYQAKGIKARISELELHQATDETKAKKLEADVARYKLEQQEASDAAKRLEGERDEAARHSGPLGNGIAALQIAIALGSICILTKKKLLFGAAAVLGFGGVALVIQGLFFV
jgi:hypothetical protein